MQFRQVLASVCDILQRPSRMSCRRRVSRSSYTRGSVHWHLARPGIAGSATTQQLSRDWSAARQDSSKVRRHTDNLTCRKTSRRARTSRACQQRDTTNMACSINRGLNDPNHITPNLSAFLIRVGKRCVVQLVGVSSLRSLDSVFNYLDQCDNCMT